MIHVSHRQYFSYTAWCIAAVSLITAFYIYSADIANVLQNAFQNKTAICKDCNILLVTIDSCSARNIGCYGYSRDTMTALCSFAEENIKFNRTFSTDTWTLPSHVSMFTGLYTSRHTVDVPNKDVLPDNIPLLSEVLNKSGYESIFYTPKLSVVLPASIYVRNTKQELPDSVDIKEALTAFKANVQSGKKTFMSVYSDENCHEPYTFPTSERMYTNDTLPFYDDQKDLSKVNIFSEEFYEYLLQVLPDIISRNDFFEKTYIVKELYSALSHAKNYESAKTVFYKILQNHGENDSFFSHIHYVFAYDRHIDPQDVRQMEYFRALYDEKLNELDREIIPALVEVVQDDELNNNTILIITSEHGQEHGEHGVMGHKTMYDGNLHVPLVIRIPGIKNISIDQDTQLTDIMPTILDAVGIQTPLKLDGISLIPYIRNTTKSVERMLVTEHFRELALRTGEWKLFATRDVSTGEYIPYELYNTLHDPGENNNILFSNVPRAKSMIERYEREVRERPVLK